MSKLIRFYVLNVMICLALLAVVGMFHLQGRRPVFAVEDAQIATFLLFVITAVGLAAGLAVGFTGAQIRRAAQWKADGAERSPMRRMPMLDVTRPCGLRWLPDGVLRGLWRARSGRDGVNFPRA